MINFLVILLRQDDPGPDDPGAKNFAHEIQI